MLSQTPTDRWKLAWLLLGVFYLLFGLLYSVIQPPTALPDEGANMQYVQFLGTQGHLPVWEPSGQGAGGYETQHPPLAYTLQSLVWRAAAACRTTSGGTPSAGSWSCWAWGCCRSRPGWAGASSRTTRWPASPSPRRSSSCRSACCTCATPTRTVSASS